jgi:hypothetical protein
MQDFWDIIKTPNLQIMDIEGEEKQTIGIENIFNKIIVANFPSLEKERVIQVQKSFRTSNRQSQKRISLCHSTIKTLSIQKKERILKAKEQNLK